MSTKPSSKTVAAELLEQLKRDRERIAAEVPEAIERGERLREAAAENTVCGHLRRAIHQSRRPLDAIASDAGIDVELLCDWLAASVRGGPFSRSKISAASSSNFRLHWCT